MKQRLSILKYLVGLIILSAGCSDPAPLNRECTPTCGSGEICLEGVCRSLCSANRGCDPGLSCQSGVCTDEPCTVNEDCDDSNDCTDNACVDSLCRFLAKEGSCDDNDACTTDDVCSEGECTGAAVVCNDDNACTVGTCNSSTGDCAYTDAPDDTICRASKGACDAVETCNAGTCPEDSVQPVSFVCRAENGICDVEDTCDGKSIECPSDEFASATKLCRPVDGDCDQEETCSGVSPDCPADNYATTGVCRVANGDCDVEESCDGSGPDCPTDGFATGGICRVSGSLCDSAEVCDGTQADCPTDAVLAQGTPCRPAAGECDVADVCDGLSAICSDYRSAVGVRVPGSKGKFTSCVARTPTATDATCCLPIFNDCNEAMMTRQTLNFESGYVDSLFSLDHTNWSDGSQDVCLVADTNRDNFGFVEVPDKSRLLVRWVGDADLGMYLVDDCSSAAPVCGPTANAELVNGEEVIDYYNDTGMTDDWYLVLEELASGTASTSSLRVSVENYSPTTPSNNCTQAIASAALAVGGHVFETNSLTSNFSGFTINTMTFPMPGKDMVIRVVEPAGKNANIFVSGFSNDSLGTVVRLSPCATSTVPTGAANIGSYGRTMSLAEGINYFVIGSPGATLPDRIYVGFTVTTP